MKLYLRFYRWAMQMKLRMGIYTVALLFCKIVWNWYAGIYEVRSLDILTIWATCLIFAMVESAILPNDNDRTYSKKQTAVWAVAANLIFLVSAFWNNWFQGIGGLGTGVLLFFLELVLALMWFGDNVARYVDSAQLNRQLKAYQKKTQK